ncbi:MAG: hypothetical protein KDA91_06705 [Planctomycetaceae bacterium]|nr:hypothetical protein [Planctomycetaceae bacterium]
MNNLLNGFCAHGPIKMRAVAMIVTGLSWGWAVGDAAADDEGSASRPLITCMTVTADAGTLLDASQLGVRVRDSKTLLVRRTISSPCRMTNAVCLSADETRLVAAGGNPGEYAWVAVYSWPDCRLLWQKTFADDFAYAVSLAPTSGCLALGLHDQSIVLLDLTDGRLRHTLRGHSRPVTAVCFIDDQTLVSGSVDQSLIVWDCVRGTSVRSLTNHTQPVTCITLRPMRQGQLPMIATASEDRTVRFWQPTIGRLVRFHRLSSPVTSLAWDGDGTHVVAGSWDGRVRTIQVDTLETLETCCHPEEWITYVTTAPDGSFTLVANAAGKLHVLPGRPTADVQ